MSEQGKIEKLIDYIINNAECCPFGAIWEDSVLEKECVGLGEVGCGACILRNIEKLDC